MTDIVISIKPKYVEQIIKKLKNYEFRNYIPKQGVTRLWIYTSTPIKKLEYVADIDTIVKQPEIIPEDGIGNHEFNKKISKYCYAYHIKHLFKLEESINLQTLKLNFNVTAPQSYFYLKNNKNLEEYLRGVKLNKIY